MDKAPFPHCNTEVLHTPGTCQYCDGYPDRQAMRAASGTPFTPAEANGWPGNVAQLLDQGRSESQHDRPGRKPISMRRRLRDLMGLR